MHICLLVRLLLPKWWLSMKTAFNLPEVLKRIEKAIAPYPKAAMFLLFDEGYASVFEQLVSCIISIRTLDETTIPVAKRLFAKARTPKEMLALSVAQIAKLIHGSTFPGQKAQTISSVATIASEKFNGHLPPDYTVLTSIKGVGPKCANLTLGVAAGIEAISVDIHVHRVVNRWGLVTAATPEKTLTKLQSAVPQKYWTDINRLLMPFGKHLCTRHLPQCSVCPVLEYCQQIGVKKHR